MKLGNIIFFAIFLLIMFFSTAMNIFGDLFWFTSIGYESVFLKMFTTNIMLMFFFGLFFVAFVLINLKVAKRFALPKNERKGKRSIDMLLITITLVITIFISTAFAKWDVFLKYANYTPFGTLDPVFGMDVGFYVFSLPFLNHILGFLVTTVVLSIALTFGGYLLYTSSVVRKDVDDEIEVVKGMGTYAIEWDSIGKKAEAHIGFLAGILFFLISYGIYLARYNVLFSKSGVVFGAGYTDIFIALPMLNFTMIISAIVGIIFIANTRIGKPKISIYSVAFFVAIVIVGLIASGVVQGFIVGPDEFNLEKTYIGNNIENTLKAYNIDTIEEDMFPISYDLTAEDIAANNGTINNIRLWDWRPLIQTYNQLQLFRTYYSFNDVDIDRYDINGEYKEVMISARGLNTKGLSKNAQTWVNKHMVYTHGYGVVMNPIDKVSEGGLPEFYIKDIPPSSDYFNIERPEIYYGDGFWDYAVVKTTTEEFDYPSGDQNAYTSYEGTGGVPLTDGFKRLVYAAKLGSIELLVSGSMTPESKLMLYRDIRMRATRIANFLLFDRDPYIVVSEGKLYWVLDAYTVTNMYPYSEPVYHSGYDEEFNYIRNSVKVVVDAYNGDTSFYVIDENDPLIQTYSKIFPDLFRSFDDMSEDMKMHLRYPEDLFRIQAELYSQYHMKDPRVFYNKEDSWEIPNEIYIKNRQEMQPYYVITKLSGDEEEFILMMPFIPRGKENLIAWMAARCDKPNYGKLVVYQFSKQELTYGPMQIEAKIDQDTGISQKMTLWGQSGSSVIRGNTLVIPIEDSILYIEPIYLEATEKGTLPQLKRVIVAYGDKISMKETLSEALSDVLGSYVPGDSGSDVEELNVPKEILDQISDIYDNAENALKTGNLAEYGRYIDQIGQILENWKSAL